MCVSITRTMSKHDTFNQSGRPLTSKQSSILEADHRVESYYTEDTDFRVISVRLADGYNYEGRRFIMANDWAEVKHNLDSIEEGEPEEE